MIKVLLIKTYTQHHSNAGKSNASEAEIKAKMSALITFIQYYSRGSSECSKARKGIQVRSELSL